MIYPNNCIYEEYTPGNFNSIPQSYCTLGKDDCTNCLNYYNWADFEKDCYEANKDELFDFI